MKPEPVPEVGTTRAEYPIGVMFSERSWVLVASSTWSAAEVSVSNWAATAPPSPTH